MNVIFNLFNQSIPYKLWNRNIDATFYFSILY